ncbi:MAG TPA: hypothetical protein VH083_17280, partial [Myxococcales bacterium]|nr:hypothetical protein [Myxococcales bacterium]
MQSLLIALLLAARPFTADELLKTRRADDVKVSPDGSWASVTVRQKDLELNRDVKDIWLLPLKGGTARQFTRNGKSEHARWSPDSRQLLITREGQLWLYTLDGGDARQLTFLSTGADGGIFSNDGKTIAFTSDVFPQCADDKCNAATAADRANGGIKARVVDHLFARHWTEWKEGKRSHMFLMSALGGNPRDVTPG